MDDCILRVDGLTKHFPVREGRLGLTVRQVRAVDGVSFEIRRHEVLGLVGESGCGKSTTGRLIARLIEPTAGHVLFEDVDLASASGNELHAARRRMQMIFQDPYSSLNPRMRIGDIVAEPLVIHDISGKHEIADRTREMLASVGLRPDYLRRFPHELSGGQRQRVAIARALILNPALVIADEPVSALDVSIQAQILNLLDEIQESFRLSLLMISHNMAVIQHACDRVAVMYLGQIVEFAETDALLMAPLHPYTRALVSAVPVANGSGKRRKGNTLLRGEVPSPIDPPSGCRFHTRCPHVQPRCKAEQPQWREIEPGHHVACHFAGEV